MDFKRQKIDSKSSLSAPLPYYDEAEITKKLAEHTKYLHEWEELINRNADPTVTAISQKDASRHIYLKKKLHDSLGIMARIVQHQMALKKAGNQIASEPKDGTTADTSEPHDKKQREPVNYPLGGGSSIGAVDNHSSSSHAAPPSSYLYAGHPSHFSSATTYQPYSNSNAYSTTTQQPAPPLNAMYSYPHQNSSHTSSMVMAPGMVNNEYIRLPNFASQPTSSSQLNHGRFPNHDVTSNNLNEGGIANQHGISYSQTSHGAPLLHPSDPQQELH